MFSLMFMSLFYLFLRVEVCACDNLEPTLLSKIGPWDLEDIRPPAPPSDVSSSSDDGDNRTFGGIPRSQVIIIINVFDFSCSKMIEAARRLY